jgi:hypothetical protein
MWPFAVLLFFAAVWFVKAARRVAIRAAILLIDLVLIPLKLGRAAFAPRCPSPRKTS